MGDAPAPSRRLLTGVALIVLGVIEVQSLTAIVRWQGTQRRRAMRGIEDSFGAARPQLEASLRDGGESGWREALRVALRATGAAEAEMFDQAGHRLAAVPRAAPVRHWIPPLQLTALNAGGVVTVGPIAGQDARVLAYAGVISGDRQMVLRLALPAPDLVADLREQRELLMSHGAALLLLLVFTVLLLLPARPVSTATPRALEAYVEAIERLRRHGEALSQRHQSERQRMEEELRDKDAMVRAGELTAGMVHEVRNGLGTILGYARLIEQSSAPSAAAETAARIREECETLEGVVRRFMEFVKRETLELSPFALSRMLARVAARESRNRPGAEVVLRGGAEQEIRGDEALLERAFENLVRNGREAAGGRGHVWIDWAREGDTVTVTVSDDGPGLSPGLRQQLRPFFTTRAGGLGLGLPIALKIVRLHEGELALEDRPPKGLSVRVRLPAEGAHTTVRLPDVTKRAPAAGTSRPDPTHKRL